MPSRANKGCKLQEYVNDLKALKPDYMPSRANKGCKPSIA